MRHLLLVAALGLTGCLATVRTGPGAGPPPPMEEGPRLPPPPDRRGPPILTGVVIDARTHNPIDKVMIDVNPKSGAKGFVLQTGPDGRFISQPLEPGGYAIRARLNGYEMENRAVNVVDGEARADFQLQLVHH
jgi:hypothetical protein